MADVQYLKDKGIPLKIDGSTRFVKGATKYTTCGDVIKMVLKKTGVGKEYRHLFAIYEVSRDGENALPCNCRIIKVVDAWKGEPNKLVLRKSETLTPPTFEKKKRWNLKRKPKQPLPEDRKSKDSYIQTLQTLVGMMDKQIQTYPSSEDRHTDVLSDSTSDSDSSIDEFLSKLDHSKMAGLVNFFAAMATKKLKRDSRQRSRSISTQESDVSSDASPVKPRRRKIKKARQPLLRKPKSKVIRNRLRESADVHPNKMHAVKQVNFGFIDAEPRLQDVVYSLPDVRPVEMHEARMRSNSNKIFSARRRLLPGKKCSYNVFEENRSGKWCKIGSSVSEYTDPAEPCKLRRMSGNCKELWCASPIPLVDSGHEDSSDTSSDLDTAFMLRNNIDDVINGRHCINTPEQGRIFQNCANIRHVTSSARKLVEYSITDDEFVETDSEDHLDSSGTDDENFHADNCAERIVKTTCIDKSPSIQDKHTLGVNENDSCANYSNNHANTCQALKHDVTNYIKSIFGKTVENEDDEMNSFMRSLVLNDFSDEGLSSMGSDLETV